MALGITTVVGHGPIPFSGMGFGSAARRTGRRGAGRSPSFAGSADLVTIAQQALVRYQAAIDVANEKCEETRGILFSALDFSWLTGKSAEDTLCSAAAQMQMNFDYYKAKIQDPYTSDDQIAEIIGFINKETDISDLIAYAEASDAITVAGEALLHAPGTAVGLVGSGVGTVAGGILTNIPWWGWAIGAVFLATQLGWEPLKYKPLRKG